MIHEPSLQAPGSGWIEVICGGMFSGKTEEMIRRARRALIAGQKVRLFKPALDNRYAEEEITSHNATMLPALAVETADQLILLSSDADVVCVDEAQFFDLRLVDVVNHLANDGKRVILAGLDMDYLGKPFEPIPQLMAIAEYVTKLHAICTVSGTLAHYSQRVVDSDSKVLLGEYDAYEPRSRQCFRPPVDSPTPRNANARSSVIKPESHKPSS
jgi:thymidine kinase